MTSGVDKANWCGGTQQNFRDIGPSSAMDLLDTIGAAPPGPGFFSIDPSIFREFAIKESLRLQFRVEVFNVLNWTNYANPTVTFNSGSFGLISNTRNGSMAPGLGFGEPRNAQLAMKVVW